MANRVTAAELEEIIDVDSSITTTQQDVFITQANLIVNDLLLTCGYSAAHLKEIERLLAAHLISALQRQASSEKVGDASITYQGNATGLNLDATLYGQNAKMLDTCGQLQNLGKTKAKIQSLRTDPQ
jgi:hypothetical protein